MTATTGDTVPPEPQARPASFGLFLNMGRNIADTADEVVALTLEQAQVAERAGLHDLWLSEHHFIPFGINPSALTAAAFLLGRTERLRVGTAVTLSPLYHPIELAERAALLDQMSGGRFDLGIGRGGYLKDYEVLDVDVERWAGEPARSAEAILQAWTNRDLAQPHHTTGPSVLEPPPRTQPHPPLFIATRSADAIEFAATNRLPLQHYFASPIKQRVELEAMYAQANPDARDVAHLHTLIVVVADDEEAARAELTEELTRSFEGGNWPHVPHADQNRRGHGTGTSDRDEMARYVARGAIVGTVDEVHRQIADFRRETGASRLAFFVEAVARRDRILETIEALADHAP
ncbi:MAG: LLM class flavin-dependent oxidoreductase [Actinomycetota bacterium]